MDESKLKERVNDGLNAEKLMDDLSPTLTAIRADLYRQFTKTKYKQVDDREEIWRKMQALEWVENNINRRVRTGEQAQKTLYQRMKDKITNTGS